MHLKAKNMKKKEKKRRQEFSSVWAICNSRFVGVRVMEATKLRLALAQSSWLLNVPYAVKSLNLCPVLNTRVFPSMSPVIFLWFEKENENKTKQNSGKKKKKPAKQTNKDTHTLIHSQKEGGHHWKKKKPRSNWNCEIFSSDVRGR